MSGDGSSGFHWLSTGEAALEAMLQAVSEARDSVRLEMYIFRGDSLGGRFREQLTLAAARGVRVRLLLDAFGSMELRSDYWDDFREKGGQFRWFNPLASSRIAVRDHRKLLVCDDTTAFVGGFNVGNEYLGDGISQGWRDLGLRVGETLARQLGAAFDEMFQGAGTDHGRMPQLRRPKRQRSVATPAGTLLLVAPGRHRNHLEASLTLDLQFGRSVQIISAYFLPSMRLRRGLMKIARRGGRVQLILAGKSDVPLARLAAHSLYRSLLDAGVEIHEYQPQILHAKLIRIDDIAYAGSLNLDTRGLSINYELMIRMLNPGVAALARDIFKEALTHCTRIRSEEWRQGRGPFARLREKWAHFLLARVDPFLAVARHS
jgi:cardiolipin synthase